MVRVTDLDASLHFYCQALGLTELSRKDSQAGRFTLVFLACKGDENAQIELTYNWDPEIYTGGMSDLKVEWIPEGTLFKIHEYDGSESIEYKEDDHWMVA
jgi:catechol 2,3-dioxygenase-like lactoylglutathione lyase family enzyme